jgi:lysine 2,3-aminomutase
MFQCDPVAGTAHLRTPVAAGQEILDGLRGRVSGIAIPQFAVDLPGGGGKVTLAPERLVRRDGGRRTFRDVRGRTFDYVDPDDAPAGAAPGAPRDPKNATPRRGTDRGTDGPGTDGEVCA